MNDATIVGALINRVKQPGSVAGLGSAAIAAVGLSFGVPPEMSLGASAFLFTLLPDSWFGR